MSVPEWAETMVQYFWMMLLLAGVCFLLALILEVVMYSSKDENEERIRQL